ncbi:hypothetical protein GOODEAATRI_010941, partial [Goodea atripinnis]
VKNKTKEGKKLKKKQQSEEQVEDPDCDPPAPKKKKKKDRLAAAQTNGHIHEAADVNGNSNDAESPKQKTKKKKEVSESLSVPFVFSYFVSSVIFSARGVTYLFDIQVLVLAPTRELAIQVAKDFRDITKRLSIACFYGGSSYNPQRRTGRAGRTGVCICFYQRKEEDQLRYVENKAGITFRRVGVPTANDIIKSSSKDAARFLDSVPATAIEYFRESAEKLIEEKGAVDALAAALAHISGATSLEQRSLLNSDAVSVICTQKPIFTVGNIECKNTSSL